MRNVDVGHQKVSASHPRNPLVLDGADGKRAVFADDVIVSDNEDGVFTGVLFVLGFAADRSALKDAVTLADGRRAPHGHVTHENSTRSDFHLAFNDTEGTYDNALIELSLRIHKA